MTLWESFGTEEVPSAGDIISEVEYSDGSIRFHASGRAGNALIALKDSSGKILWSWHIWSCPGFNPSECSHVFNTVGGTLMDRNLGATSVVKGEPAALGLMYQWGRKDPFPGPCKTFYSPTYSQKPAATTLEWPSPVASDASKGTIAYSVSHPTTFIRGNSLSMDWYYTTSLPTDNTRWKEPASAKGLYDPCPAGWRVPGGASSVNWSGTLGNYKPFVSGPWNPEGYGMDFGTGNGNSLQLGAYSVIWYPAAGFIDGSNGELRDAGTVGRYQTCTVSHCYAYQFAVNSTAYVFPQRIGYRSCAYAVRCAAIE